MPRWRKNKFTSNRTPADEALASCQKTSMSGPVLGREPYGSHGEAWVAWYGGTADEKYDSQGHTQCKHIDTKVVTSQRPCRTTRRLISGTVDTVVYKRMHSDERTAKSFVEAPPAQREARAQSGKKADAASSHVRDGRKVVGQSVLVPSAGIASCFQLLVGRWADEGGSSYTVNPGKINTLDVTTLRPDSTIVHGRGTIKLQDGQFEGANITWGCKGGRAGFVLRDFAGDTFTWWGRKGKAFVWTRLKQPGQQTGSNAEVRSGPLVPRLDRQVVDDETLQVAGRKFVEKSDVSTLETAMSGPGNSTEKVDTVLGRVASSRWQVATVEHGRHKSVVGSSGTSRQEASSQAVPLSWQGLGKKPCGCTEDVMCAECCRVVAPPLPYQGPINGKPKGEAKRSAPQQGQQVRRLPGDAGEAGEATQGKVIQKKNVVAPPPGLELPLREHEQITDEAHAASRGTPDSCYKYRLRELLGRWADQTGSVYTIQPGAAHSLDVVTFRPNGKVIHTRGTIRVGDSQVAGKDIIWGRKAGNAGFVLRDFGGDTLTWCGSYQKAFRWRRVTQETDATPVAIAQMCQEQAGRLHLREAAGMPVANSWEWPLSRADKVHRWLQMILADPED